MQRMVTRKALGFLFGVLAASVALAGAASAKQCVWNKGGFVVRVDWFDENAVELSGRDANGVTEIDIREQPVQSDTFATASGRCISRGKKAYLAIVSICEGSDYKYRITGMPDDWPADQRNTCVPYLVTTPSMSRYLDLWGTIWNPSNGAGGPL